MLKLTMACLLMLAICTGSRADAVKLESPLMIVEVDDMTGWWTLLDKRSQTRWPSKDMATPGTATWLEGNVKETQALTDSSVRLRCQNGAAVVFALAEGGAALDIRYEGKGDDPVRIFNDVLAVTNVEGGYAIVPCREGLLIPADSEKTFKRVFGTSDYEGSHMNMLGFVKGGSAMIATWDDAYVFPKQITQNAIDKFILDRGKETKRSTLNKDITNLKAFVNWGRANRYINGDIKLKLLKEDERPVISLSATQIKKLLSAAKPYPRLRMRILLALGTGLRRGDIDKWNVSDLDCENSYVTTRSTKTRKSMGSRPLPVPITTELKKYVTTLDPKQERLFSHPFNQYRWTQIRDKLGLRDFKFHDLRKTFGSVLAQRGVSEFDEQGVYERGSCLKGCC